MSAADRPANRRVAPLTRGAFRQDLAAMFRLAGPVVLAQVGMMAMGVVDTAMVGRVSADALAAVALGNVYLFGTAIFGMGALLALDPVVAQAVGANDQAGITRGLQRGIVLAAVLAVPSSLLLLPAAPLLRLLGQPPEVIPDAAGYARVQIAGILPFYLFIAVRQTLQSLHRTAPIVWAIVIANLLHVPLNWALIFGHAGAPALGAVGASWATAGSRWFLVILLLTLARRDLAPYLAHWRRDTFAPGPLWRMLVLGAPIGAQHQLEYGIFAVVGLLMGAIGSAAMAGHQVALNLASLTFMVPFGVASATAVLVGNAIGRGDPGGAQRAAAAGLLIALAFMSVSAATMVSVPGLLARFYTDQPAVVAVAAALIPLAGVFQVFDGLQVVSIGILRGTADTRTPLVINVIGFWLVGLPISAWLGLRTSLGPRGLWWGLVAGLAAVALILLGRVRSRMAAPLSRVIIDQPLANDG